MASVIAQHRTPEIFNTDQGSQFTSSIFTTYLLDNGIKVSMDGRGRAIDNVYIERLWRSVKQKTIYLNAYESGQELYAGLKRFFQSPFWIFKFLKNKKLMIQAAPQHRAKLFYLT